MKPPPYLLGVAFLAWGWAAGLFWLGGLLAVCVEGPRWLRVRWAFTEEELIHAARLCMVMFLGAAVIAFAFGEGANPFSRFLQANNLDEQNASYYAGVEAILRLNSWLPIVWAPLLLLRVWHEGRSLNWKTIWRLFQGSPAESAVPDETNSRVVEPPIEYIAFSLLLLAAASSNRSSLFIYPGLCLLCGIAAWNIRSPRFSPLSWIAAFALACGAGLALAFLFLKLEGWSSHLQTALVNRFARQGFDATESQMYFGRIGDLKGMGGIVARVKVLEGRPPELLREAVYDLHRPGAWFTTDREFIPVSLSEAGAVWRLNGEGNGGNSIETTFKVQSGKPLLPIARGTQKVGDLGLVELETNRLGSVRLAEGPPLVRCELEFGEAGYPDAGPSAEKDLQIPVELRPVIGEAAERIRRNRFFDDGLASTLAATANYFASEFNYSTYQDFTQTLREGGRPLEVFLNERRAGHCELFATSSVLLLRHFGIPARYAVGYAVMETAGESQYLLRRRHAHAWALYYDPDRRQWLDFDATPGTWLEAEEKNASRFEPLWDALSGLGYRFQVWRYYGDREALPYYLLAGIAALIALTLWRIFRSQRGRNAKTEKTISEANRSYSGLDSEFFRIESALRDKGAPRLRGETVREWIRRNHFDETIPLKEFRELLNLHYRYRFDPEGLDAASRERLRAAARIVWEDIQLRR